MLLWTVSFGCDNRIILNITCLDSDSTRISHDHDTHINFLELFYLVYFIPETMFYVYDMLVYNMPVLILAGESILLRNGLFMDPIANTM